MDEVSEGDTSIQSRSLLETSQLAWMNEIVQNQKELEAFANDFLDKFS